LLRDGEITAWISTLLWILNTALLAYRFYNHIDYPDYFFEHKSRLKHRKSDAKPNEETSFTSTNSKGEEDDQNNEEEDDPNFERLSSESFRLSRRKKKRRVNFEDFYADSPPSNTMQPEPVALIQFENEYGNGEEEEDGEFETADSETPNEDDANNGGQHEILDAKNEGQHEIL